MIVGMGDVVFETNIRCKLVLKNVRHISKICFNLIFMSILDDERFDNYFDRGKWKLNKGSYTYKKVEN